MSEHNIESVGPKEPALRISKKITVVSISIVVLAIVFLFGIFSRTSAVTSANDTLAALDNGKSRLSQLQTTDCSRSIFVVMKKCRVVNVSFYSGDNDLTTEKADWSERLKAQDWPLVNTGQEEYFIDQPVTRVIKSSAVSYRKNGLGEQGLMMYVTNSIPPANGQEFQSTGIRYTDQTVYDALKSANPQQLIILQLSTEYYTFF